MFTVNNRLKRSLAIIAISLLFISFFGDLGVAQDLPSLFTSTDNETSSYRIPESLPDRINVKVDFSLMSSSSSATVRAALPDREVVLLRERIESRSSDNYTWIGRVKDRELSTVVITVVNGIAVGHIDFEGQSYSLNPQNDGYQIVKKDAAKSAPFYDDESIPVIPVTGEKRSPLYPLNRVPEDGSRIDVLVLYTQQMADTYGTGLAAKIQNFVDVANTAYTNSGISTQIRMVNSALFADQNAAEGVSLKSALDYITGASNGQITGTPPSTIQILRETYQADLVSLLRVYPGTPGGSCGQGWVLKTDNNTFADFAFSVTEVKDNQGIAGQSYCVDTTFAHELGHNMGCAHDRAHEGTYGGAYSYSYGYGFDGQFGTVMSYISPHITYFSTPLVNYQGQPIGKDESQTDSADNAKSINNTRATVANFRTATTSNCAAVIVLPNPVSPGLVVHIPVITYSTYNFGLDLTYDAATSAFLITNGGLINDMASYSNCAASILSFESSNLKLRIPVIMFKGMSFSLDLQYKGSGFVITGAGVN